MSLIKQLLKEYSSSDRSDLLSDNNFRFGIEIEGDVEKMQQSSNKDYYKEIIDKKINDVFKKSNKYSKESALEFLLMCKIEFFLDFFIAGDLDWDKIDQFFKIEYPQIHKLYKNSNGDIWQTDLEYYIMDQIKQLSKDPNLGDLTDHYYEFYQFLVKDNSMLGLIIDSINEFYASEIQGYDIDKQGEELAVYNFFDDIEYYGRPSKNPEDLFTNEYKAYTGKDNFSWHYDANYLEIINSSLFESLEELIIFYEDVIYVFNQIGIETHRGTSAHINISYKTNEEPIPIKALFFINDKFATKYLRSSNWARDIVQRVMEEISTSINNLLYNKFYNNKDQKPSFDIPQFIKKVCWTDRFMYTLNQKTMNIRDPKSAGVNFFKMNEANPYIEFRYPSSDVPSNTLEERVIYYMYITKLTFDPEYKKDKFRKRLYKYLYKELSDYQERYKK